MTRLAGVVLAVFAAAASAQADLERFVQDLGNDKGDACYQAYLELSRRRDPAVVPLLGKGITGFPRQGQQYAVYLLRAQPIDVTRAVWKKLLDAETAYLRVAAASSLAQQNERGAVEKLAAGLRGAAENERAGLIYLTYGVDDKEEVFAALLTWLHPTANSGTVVATLQRLAQFPARTAAVRAAVEPLAGADDVGTRAAALAFLAGFDKARADELTALLKAEPARLAAIRFLLDSDRKLPPPLLEVIANSLAKAQNAYEITQTAALLHRQGSSAAVPHLRDLLHDTKAELRAAALEALEADGGGLEDKDLRAMLHDSDVAAALIAADLLRRRDDFSGIEVVLAAVQKAGPQLFKAAEVLGKFRDRRAGPLLIDLLDHADARVRREAWNGLQALMRDLFPYRRFDFEKCGYAPESASRQGGIATVRNWWDTVPKAQ